MAKKKRKSITATIPGWTPNYQQLLVNDPSYTQFVGGQEIARGAGRTARNNGIIQRLIQFGQLPDLTGIDLGDFGIDPATIAQIQANTAGGASTVAGLQRTNLGNVDALQQSLAARGLLRSGTLGLGLGQEQTRYAGAQKTARDELLAALQGLQTEFAGDEATRATELTAFGEEIGPRIREANPARAARQVKARKVGPNLYQDADGNYYDRHGNSTLDPNRPLGPKRRAPALARRFSPARRTQPGYGYGGGGGPV